MIVRSIRNEVGVTCPADVPARELFVFSRCQDGPLWACALVVFVRTLDLDLYLRSYGLRRAFR
jgi:hypothetical protein